MKKVLIIGSSTTDIYIYPDHTKTMHLGGCALNVCHVLHHLQAPYTFLSTVGTGRYGEFVHKELEKLGIEHHAHSQEENGYCLCHIDNSGERSFQAVHGAEYLFDFETFSTLPLQDYSYIYLCGLEVAERTGSLIVSSLLEYTGTIFFAPGPYVQDIPVALLHALYKKHCILHLNEEEIKELSGKQTWIESVRTMYQKTQNLIFITAGSKGSYYYDGTLHFFKTAPCAIKNTNGAGDNHAGALLTCLAYEKSLDFSMKFANEVAGQVVQSDSTHLSNYDPFLKKIV